MLDVVIVGAGPAGIAGALAAAARGLQVVVVDEQARVGGQIFRQPPAAFAGESLQASGLPAGYRWGGPLLDRAEAASGIQWLLRTSALGVLHDEDEAAAGRAAPGGAGSGRARAGGAAADSERAPVSLVVSGPDGVRTIRARRLLVATGAYDLPVAFPGWTLPGVMMAGGVQTFLKSQKLLVADRFVLAGAHPLLFVVADLLRKAGADIAEVAFARGLPGPKEMLGSIPALPGHTGMLAAMSASIAGLVASGVPVRTRTIVQRAIGTDHVAAVDLAPVDDAWQISGPSHRVAATGLVLGYGFTASTELARQVGCSIRWDSAAGGWIVERDRLMRTSVPGVYVAGEPGGVAGAEQSAADGHLAGIMIAHSLGLPVTKKELAAARRRVDSAARFSRVVQRMFAPQRGGLADLATGDTLLCRCEQVTRATVDETLAANPPLRTASAVKLACRAGMGPCQGRYCETNLAGTVAAGRGISPSDVGCFTGRFPLRPVPLAALAQLDAIMGD